MECRQCIIFIYQNFHLSPSKEQCQQRNVDINIGGSEGAQGDRIPFAAKYELTGMKFLWTLPRFLQTFVFICTEHFRTIGLPWVIELVGKRMKTLDNHRTVNILFLRYSLVSSEWNNFCHVSRYSGISNFISRMLVHIRTEYSSCLYFYKYMGTF